MKKLIIASLAAASLATTASAQLHTFGDGSVINDFSLYYNGDLLSGPVSGISYEINVDTTGKGYRLYGTITDAVGVAGGNFIATTDLDINDPLLDDNADEYAVNGITPDGTGPDPDAGGLYTDLASADLDASMGMVNGAVDATGDIVLALQWLLADGPGIYLFDITLEDPASGMSLLTHFDGPPDLGPVYTFLGSVDFKLPPPPGTGVPEPGALGAMAVAGAIGGLVRYRKSRKA